MLDEPAEAAAVVAAEEDPNSAIPECLLPACQVRKGALLATVMLYWVGPAVPQLLDFPLERIESVWVNWPTRMEQIWSRTIQCESEAWSKFSQTINSGKVHLGHHQQL